MDELIWKPDWPAARRAFVDWWAGKGLALCITAPKDEPWEDIPASPPAQAVTRWTDAEYRVQSQLHRMSRTFYGGTAFPIFGTDVGGPGSLGLFLGCGGHPDDETVWYDPCISDPENHPPLYFDPSNEWWRLHVAAIKAGLENAKGRYLVGCADLIENIDTLAQLRGPEDTLTDLLERPAWVKDKIAEINRAFFECYDLIYDRIRDPWGGSTFGAFGVWGPGKTVKVQCDFSCMISTEMFREFVVPALSEQCDWLDNSLYHLDGALALHHLPALLEIESLNAIEFTPEAGTPDGGSPHWYDLYRRIKAGGKGVQAIGVAHDEVLPLLDAVGPEGMMIHASAPSESEARRVLRSAGWPD